MRHYEIVFLVHPDQSDQTQSVLNKFSTIVTESGGKFSTWDGVSLLGKDAIATNGLLHTELSEMLK